MSGFRYWEIPESEFRLRVKKVQHRMVERGLSVLLVYSPRPYHVGGSDGGNVRYLAGWVQETDQTLLLVPAEGDPVLFASPINAGEAEECSWIQKIVVSPRQLVPSKVKEVFGRSGSDGRIGVVGKDSIPVWLYDGLRGSLSAEDFVDSRDILDELRSIKSPNEIRVIRRAAEICDLMLQVFQKNLRAGAWVYKVKAEMEYAARLEGAEFAGEWLAWGRTGDVQFYSTGGSWAKFKKADTVLCGVHLVNKGYWGHGLRTGVISHPSKEQKDSFRVVYEATEAFLKRAGPGVDVSEATRAADKVIEEMGYSNAVPFRYGHSLGLDYADLPYSNAFPQPYAPTGSGGYIMKPGMTFELHISVSPMKAGSTKPSAALGDMILVTDNGADLLTKIPRRLLRAT